MPPSKTVAHLAPTLLGVSTGLRSFTALAVASWFARLGELPVEGTWASWMAHPATVGLLTAAALGETIGDKLPSTPDRTSPLPLVGRLVMGGLVGSVVATALRRDLLRGVALGALGAAAGTYGGFYLRKGLSKGIGINDIPVGISGDAVAVALAVRSLRRLTA